MQRAPAPDPVAPPRSGWPSGSCRWACSSALEPGLLADLALFFSTLAVVTFGGAYAVLAYMTQAVVTDFGWLTTAQMIDALGLAETTPGPLILVTQFVGILAGIAQGGIGLGIMAGIVTLWMTFTPCFLWIFTGAPYIDALAYRPRLRGALAAVTAAVVGVILNLSLWFALHVIFADVTLTRFGPLPDCDQLSMAGRRPDRAGLSAASATGPAPARLSGGDGRIGLRAQPCAALTARFPAAWFF